MNYKSTSNHSEQLEVALCGACLAGNLGGQALYLSLVDELERIAGPVKVTVLSKYPADDQSMANVLGWRLVNYSLPTQVALAGLLLPTSAIARLVGVPSNRLGAKILPALSRCQVLIDMSGISFSDYRSLAGLIINSLWLMAPLALQVPYVKASQAMGPFNGLLVRLAAQWLLPPASALVARGAETRQLLQNLLPKSEVHELPDSAFCLEPALSAEIDRALHRIGIQEGEPFVCMGPSFVVDDLLAHRYGSGHYVQLIFSAIKKLHQMSGMRTVLVAHEEPRLSGPNDLSCCRKLADLAGTSRAVVLEPSGSARLVKGVIGRSRVAIGSRFHFVVAALSSGTPALAIGWGHKYHEMMQALHMDDWSLDYSDLNAEKLISKISDLWQLRANLADRIQKRLPQVIADSRLNARVALSAAFWAQSKNPSN